MQCCCYCTAAICGLEQGFDFRTAEYESKSSKNASRHESESGFEYYKALG